MKLVTKFELKVEGYEKCSSIIDTDCPLGQLYDYACSLKTFVCQKMKEAEEQQQKPSEKV